MVDWIISSELTNVDKLDATLFESSKPESYILLNQQFKNGQSLCCRNTQNGCLGEVLIFCIVCVFTKNMTTKGKFNPLRFCSHSRHIFGRIPK